MNKQPEIAVGIMAGTAIEFVLSGKFRMAKQLIDEQLFCQANLIAGEIVVSANNEELCTGTDLLFEPVQGESSFLLKEVVIGVNFHWEQKENLRFQGALRLLVLGGTVQVINYVPIEDYLCSVISSEMNPSSSFELLKAHAVISRSWLLAQINKRKNLLGDEHEYKSVHADKEEYIRWYDREDHELFDVCADDHCQRYQGITRIANPQAVLAVVETAGEVLMADDQICDTRFSKCCGGVTESFEKVWEPVPHSYLTTIYDTPSAGKNPPDLRFETAVRRWIAARPDCFCNTRDQAVLAQVLPGFDLTTTDFFRWEVCYSQSELSALVHQKTGIDFGQITRLEAIERGYSGRLVKLKIHGTKRKMTIGKELEIRRALSASHLYSSAFYVDHEDIQDEIPQTFRFKGAGWGHGVGLCQIGAAMMGEQGFSYEAILKHYFNGAETEKIYG